MICMYFRYMSDEKLGRTLEHQMKTEWEKAAEKVANTVKEVLLRNFDDEFFKKADVMGCYPIH